MPMQFARHDDLIEIQVIVSDLPITLPQIREALNEAGYGRCQIITDQVTNFIADYEVIQADIRAGKLPPGQKIGRRIAVRRNAELRINKQWICFQILNRAVKDNGKKFSHLETPFKGH